MLDTFKPAHENTDELSSREWNAVRELSRRYGTNTKNQNSGVPLNSTKVPSLIATVKNSSGAACSTGYVLKVIGALAEFPNTLLACNESPYLDGDEPDATTNVVVITDEPIANGKYGRAIIAGIVTCTVNITDASHEYATPTSGDTTKLTSAASGPIKILAKASAGTGNKDCMVLLQSWGPESTLIYVNAPYTSDVRYSKGWICKFDVGGGYETTPNLNLSEEVLVRNFNANSLPVPSLAWGSYPVKSVVQGVFSGIKSGYKTYTHTNWSESVRMVCFDEETGIGVSGSGPSGLYKGLLVRAEPYTAYSPPQDEVLYPRTAEKCFCTPAGTAATAEFEATLYYLAVQSGFVFDSPNWVPLMNVFGGKV